MKNLIACVAFLFASPSFAQDVAASATTQIDVSQENSDAIHRGGEAAALFPIENTSVRFVEQRVEMEGGVHSWKTTATFLFKNESDKPTKVMLAFPLLKCSGAICDENDEGDVVCTPCDKLTEEQRQSESQRQTSFLHSFRAIIRGKPVNVHKVDLSKPVLNYSQAYVFEADFAAGETVEIVNHYSVDANWHEAMDTYGEPEKIYAAYAMKTAALWQGGKVERTVLEIRPHFPWSPCDINAPQNNVQRDGFKRKLVWTLTDISPERDFEICLMDHKTMTFEATNGSKMNLRDCARELENLTLEDVKRCRNLPYALHGYAFKNKAMRELFQSQKWYQVKKDFSPDLLTSREWELIEKLKNREAALQSVETSHQNEELPELKAH